MQSLFLWGAFLFTQLNPLLSLFNRGGFINRKNRKPKNPI